MFLDGADGGRAGCVLVNWDRSLLGPPSRGDILSRRPCFAGGYVTLGGCFSQLPAYWLKAPL